MESIGAYEAKTHLSNLLDRVANGEQFTITRHGVPVARLVPAASVAKVDPETAIQRLLDFRKGRRLDVLSIRKLIDEGRRF